MKDVGWYLVINDRMAIWHERRPGLIRRLMHRMIFGWRWKKAEGEVATLRVCGPDVVLDDCNFMESVRTFMKEK